MTTEIIVIVILLLIAAITAASEISVIAVSRIKLRRRAVDGSKTAKITLKILESPEKFFSTILVINNVVDSLIAVMITSIMIATTGREGGSIIIATLLSAFLIIVFEVVAKTLAAKHSERISMAVSRPISVLIVVLTPIIRVVVEITNFIVHLIGGKTPTEPTLVPDEEIKALIHIGEGSESKHKEKYKMLSKIFDFSEAVVKSVMTQKKDMIAIDVKSNIEDIFVKVLESGYSRLPVYRDNPDNIIGSINMKDLLSLSCNRNLVVLQDIIYPPTFVPDTKKVTELLKEFQKGHTHLAVVVDPKGKIEGLVTLEDLLEEIVGEIEDEYDIRS